MLPRPCGVRRWLSLIHSIMQKDKPMCSKKRVQYVFISAMRWDSDFPDDKRPGPPEDEAALWSGSMGANTERVSYLTIISFMGWYGINHEGILEADVTHNSQLWMSKNQPRFRSNPVPLISVWDDSILVTPFCCWIRLDHQAQESGSLRTSVSILSID